MNDSHEYIEAYFRRQLDEPEMKRFEERCVLDESFAREVALYITTEEGIRQSLLSDKQKLWTGDNHEKKPAVVRSFRKYVFSKWSVAAACLIVAAALFFLYSPDTPRDNAKRYISKHFTQLSQTMDGSGDSLQQGIAAYNNKDYDKALQIFEAFYQSHPQNFVTKKYIGFVYLVTENYDKALQQFHELSGDKGLYQNPGLFLTALTLLQRNRQGDVERARRLLEQVVKEKADGSREAEIWLRNW